MGSRIRGNRGPESVPQRSFRHPPGHLEVQPMERKPCGLIVSVPPPLHQIGRRTWPCSQSCSALRPVIFKSPAPKVIAPAIAAAKPLELAVLLADDFEAAKAAGANGVYFTAAGADVAKARAALGSAGIVGAACGLSRHTAMEAAEAGAGLRRFRRFGPGQMRAGGGAFLLVGRNHRRALRARFRHRPSGTLCSLKSTPGFHFDRGGGARRRRPYFCNRVRLAKPNVKI